MVRTFQLANWRAAGNLLSLFLVAGEVICVSSSAFVLSSGTPTRQGDRAGQQLIGWGLPSLRRALVNQLGTKAHPTVYHGSVALCLTPPKAHCL